MIVEKEDHFNTSVHVIQFGWYHIGYCGFHKLGRFSISHRNHSNHFRDYNLTPHLTEHINLISCMHCGNNCVGINSWLSIFILGKSSQNLFALRKVSRPEIQTHHCTMKLILEKSPFQLKVLAFKDWRDSHICFHTF